MEAGALDYESLIDLNDLKPICYTSVRGLDCFILVDNLPIVSEDRVEKLKKALRVKFGNFGSIVENGIVIPYNKTSDVIQGFAFIEYCSPADAANAAVCGNGFKFDAKTVLRVIPFSQVEDYLNMPDNYEPPQCEDGERGHLRSWLGDKKSRDQFVIMVDDVVYIYWNNKGNPPDIDCSRKNWTGYYVMWSPLGTYLTTFHDLGVALWGGPSWTQVCKLEHITARLVDYSPNEKYIATWSQFPISRVPNDSHNLAIWEIASGKQLRTLQIAPPPANNENIQCGLNIKVDWPVLQWSHDDKYVARIQKEALYIYELPSMECITGRGLKIPRIKAFLWSPSENVISYWTSEADNIPAKVNLMRVPTVEIIRSKNFFNVNNVQLHWQSAGDYLVVLIEGVKSKKQSVTSVEVFRVREKGIPVDRIDIGLNVGVSSPHIEPNGSRFILLVNDSDGTTCNVYKIVTKDDSDGGKKQGKKKKAVVHDAEINANTEGVTLLKVIPAREINHISWAPRGCRCVLAGIKENKPGDIRFWDMNDLVLLGSGEHRSCTSIEWDPTGRYLVSFISAWHSTVDTGFKLWTFTGKLLATQSFKDFTQFLWRPRPSFLFPKSVMEKIRKNLKEYTKILSKEDAEVDKEFFEKINKERMMLLSKWKARSSAYEKAYDDTKEERDKVWGFDIDKFRDDKSGEIEVVVVEVMEEVADA